LQGSAEAMTIFAVMCAGIFPIMHTGRPWLAGYLTPYPNQHDLWVNFISPLSLGCFCRYDLFNCFSCFLVCWIEYLILQHCVIELLLKLKKVFIQFSVWDGDIRTAIGSIMKKLI
jgi:hypothetical protein